MPLLSYTATRGWPPDVMQRAVDRLDEVCGRLNYWGQLCIEAGAFPPDILKRAAG